MEGYKFQKEERLCSQKIIGELFTSGESFLAYPLKIVFLKTEHSESSPIQAAFTVSKRNFKHAIKRNLLKRRMREVYRLNKQGLYNELAVRNIRLAVMFVYVGKEIAEFPAIEKGMLSAFKKLLGKV